MPLTYDLSRLSEDAWRELVLAGVPRTKGPVKDDRVLVGEDGDEMVVSFGPTRRSALDRQNTREFVLATRVKPTNLPKFVEHWPPEIVIRRVPRSLLPRLAAAAGVGDVLGEVAGTFAEELTRFLEAELLSDLNSRLESINSDPEKRIPLARVFVDLPTVEGPNFCAEMLASSIVFLPKEREVRHRLLIGGPGQGKTTLGQYLCQLHRTALLAPRASTLSTEAQAQVALILAGDASRPGQLRFPLRVPLHRFAAAIDPSAADPLWSWLLDWFALQLDHPVDADALRSFLASFPVLLVLDGLDEVPSSGNRNEVVAAIARFMQSFDQKSSPWADIVAVATTRPQGYRGEFDWTARILRPLELSIAKGYADRLIRERNRTDRDRQRVIGQRFERACADPRAAALTRSPLQITILCALLERQGQAPRLRWRLFRDYYRVIYDRERDREIPTAAVLNDHESIVHQLHWEVGYLLHLRAEEARGADASLAADELKEVVASILRRRGFPSEAAEPLVAKIAEAALHRLVFLTGVHDERVGFDIRSLQEFAAAERIAAAEAPVVAKRLEVIARPAHWRNVFAFVGGRGEAENEALAEAVIRVVEGAGDEAPVLAAELLAEGVGTSTPARRAVLIDRACRGLAGPRGARIVEVLAEEAPERLVDAERLGPEAWSVAARRGVSVRVGQVEGGDLRLVSADDAGRLGEAAVWQLPPESWLLERPGGPELAAVDAFRGVGLFQEEFQPFPDHEIRWTPLQGQAPRLDTRTVRHPDWAVVDTALDFVRGPSRASLAAALRASAREPRIGWLLRDQMPWPLWSLLESEAESWAATADRVDAGEYGDVEDWMEAEARWREGIEDCLTVLHDDEPPFDASVAKVGRPVGLGWRTLSDGEPPDEIRALWLSSTGRDSLLNFWMSYASDLPEREASIWKGVAASRDGWRMLLAAARRGSWGKGWLDVLDQAARTSRRKGSLRNVDGPPPDTLTNGRLQPGLVAIAAGVLRSWRGNRLVLPSAALQVDEVTTGPEIASDALLLRLSQPVPDGPGEAELRRLLPLVPTLAEDLRDVSHKVPEPHFDQTLQIAIELTQPPIRTQLAERLADRIAGRASGLADHRLAASLELPTLPGTPDAPPDAAAEALPVPAVVRLGHIHIQNLKAHADLRMEHPAAGGGQWTVLIGDNGVGKTTILRAIALALLPTEVAQAWVGMLPPPLVRIGAESVGARVELRLGERSWLFELVAGKVTDSPRLDGVFLAGYGPHRGSVHGGSSEPEYTPRWAVNTLFDDVATLTHPERWLKDFGYRATELNGADRRFFDALRITIARLLPGVDRIEVTSTEGARVHGPRFDGVPLTALSDGYLTTAAWILDLVARWAAWARARKLAVDGDFAAQMTGLVLVDEIDLHLHPQWQRDLIRRLRDLFPNLSFVATTHNPITLLGAGPGEICVLRRTEAGVTATFRDLPPGADADRVLTGDWFGLVSTVDDETLRLLDERRRLLREEPDGERAEDLREELEKRLRHPRSGVERLVESVAAQLLTEETGTLTQDQVQAARAKLLEAARAKRGGR